VANIDSVWQEPNGSAITQLVEGFKPAAMGARLLLAAVDDQIGYDGLGDFNLEDQGRLRFRGAAPTAPWAYMGVQVITPSILASEPVEPFSFTRVWRRLAGEGRLYGVPLDGFWMHVGDPAARVAAETRLAASG
jgi:MurNAc alpha-1-phosphate uridylyltransferase